MSEYYAVQRSDEFLEHYGVRGMKWGVRKAIAKGTSKALNKAYKKANRKLEKLNRRANIEVQKASAQVNSRKALATGLGAAGLGGVSYLSGKRLKPRVTGHMDGFTFNPKSGQTERIKLPTHEHISQGSKVAHGIAGALTGLAAGKTAYHAGKAIASKYRTTAKGHAKAVAKRDAWKKEMQSAFKGTKYANGTTNRQGKNRRKTT